MDNRRYRFYSSIYKNSKLFGMKFRTAEMLILHISTSNSTKNWFYFFQGQFNEGQSRWTIWTQTVGAPLRSFWQLLRKNCPLLFFLDVMQSSKIKTDLPKGYFRYNSLKNCHANLDGRGFEPRPLGLHVKCFTGKLSSP